MGRLDEARVSCVIAALPAVTEVAQARLPGVRAQRDAIRAGTTRDHARSVQQAMRVSDETDAALRASWDARDYAHQLNARGEWSDAALQNSYAIDLQNYAHRRGEITVLGPLNDRLWSDEEAGLLVEYASLRLRRDEVTAPPAQLLARLAQIENEQPHLANEYAALMIELYSDPDLPCLSDR